MTGAVILSLPPPPSVNNLFAGVGRRRVRTSRYRAWQAAAGWELLTQRPRCIAGPWQAEIVLPAKLAGDIDNRAKAILDLVVAHRIVDDDKFCQRLTISKTGTDSVVTVTLRAAT